MVTNYNPSNLTISLISYNSDGFVQLGVSYCLKVNSNKFFYIDNIPTQTSKYIIDSAANLSSGSGSRSHLITFSFPDWQVDFSHENLLLPFVRSFMFDRNATTDISLYVSLTLLNSTAYVANFSTVGNCLVQFASFSILLMDLSLVTNDRNNVFDYTFRTG
jgi:hypothetical protein